jgi:hypothetical protein
VKKLIVRCLNSLLYSFILVSLTLVAMLPFVGGVFWAKGLAGSGIYLPAIFVLLGGLSLSSYLLSVVFLRFQNEHG